MDLHKIYGKFYRDTAERFGSFGCSIIQMKRTDILIRAEAASLEPFSFPVNYINYNCDV